MKILKLTLEEKQIDRLEILSSESGFDSVEDYVMHLVEHSRRITLKETPYTVASALSKITKDYYDVTHNSLEIATLEDLYMVYGFTAADLPDFEELTPKDKKLIGEHLRSIVDSFPNDCTIRFIADISGVGYTFK
jgi:hypothetical protein